MAAAYKDNHREPWKTEGLPHKLKDWFVENSSSVKLEISSLHESGYDGSLKFIFKLFDGFEIESVLMPEKNRITICLSTQVGCAQGCVFCYTGKMGLKRNLTASEIIAQVIEANQWITMNPGWLEKLNLPKGQRITNVVFMGMGEPLDNIDQVAVAVNVFSDPWAFNLAERKITISTAGHLDGLKMAMAVLPNISYALSLHATSDSERSKLMPINRRYPLKDVLDFLRIASKGYNKDFLIQYTVIDQVNDSPEHAERLYNLLTGINVKVNLIPLNPIDPSRLNSPDPARLEAFRDLLFSLGLRVMVRYSKGQDINAACGQLVTKATLN
jgi:23S rRNA (adenine2503-C2)-methyltransferase